VSVIGAIAIVGIMLGVGVLSAVLAVTSGFQVAFREKVLGVNAHLLVLKYGWDFTEYRDVIQRVRETPGVMGAAPFLINPMMITRGDRISGVLVKGVDPELLGTVLDLPTYLVQGSMRGLRRPDAVPPAAPGEDPDARGDRTLDDWIRRSRSEVQTLHEIDSDHDSNAPSEADSLRDDGEDDSPPSEPARGGLLGAARGLGTSIMPHTLDDRSDEVAPSRPSTATASAPMVNTDAQLLPSGATPSYSLPPDLPPDEDPVERLGREIRAQADADAQRRANELPGVIVGRTLAHNLDLHVGDQVRIISPLTGADAALVRHGNTPRARDFRVTGIFDAGFDEYDSRLVYVDLWEAQRFFEQGDAVTGVEVKVRDIERAAAIGRRIERQLGGGPYHTLDWESLNRNLFTALRLQKIALSIVITIIIIVAAFNVVATLVMVVLDKRREVAIMKAMGADEAGILRIFLLQGLAIGGTGTLLGLALGALICTALQRLHFPLDPQVYLIRYVPVRPSFGEFALTGVVAMLISLVASFIPAAWAANLAPVEGLRYE
jgi:lipoprotein-releasing system permease protein